MLPFLLIGGFRWKMLASKYLFDDGTDENVVNDEWAEDFRKENAELNALEVEFLVAMV